MKLSSLPYLFFIAHKAHYVLQSKKPGRVARELDVETQYEPALAARPARIGDLCQTSQVPSRYAYFRLRFVGKLFVAIT
jgi:hypothetical protein